MAASLSELIAKAREELSKITGLELGNVIGSTKTEAGWLISVEMVEKHSIPDQMDILAVYDALMDDEGTLLQFKRKRMRKRIDTEAVEEEA